MKRTRSERGFSLLELVVITAIIGILAAVGIVGYQRYIDRARGVSIIEKYDALRTKTMTIASDQSGDECQRFIELMGDSNLTDEYATLSVGFEAVPDGYRPVLNVCAKADPQRLGVRASRGAYDTMVRDGVVESNPVITDSLVSFAMRLTQDDKALCKTAPATQVSTVCGTPPPATQTAARPPAPPVQPVSSPPKAQPSPLAGSSSTASSPPGGQAPPAQSTGSTSGGTPTTVSTTPTSTEPPPIGSPGYCKLHPGDDLCANREGARNCSNCLPGMEFLCEKLFNPTSCPAGQNFCITQIFNHQDGTRDVKRACADFDTMYNEWFQGTSDNDKCRMFNPNEETRLDFQCTFGCVADNCNEDMSLDAMKGKGVIYKPR